MRTCPRLGKRQVVGLKQSKARYYQQTNQTIDTQSYPSSFHPQNPPSHFFEERKIIALDIVLETYRNIGEIRRIERRPSFLMVDLLRPYFYIRTHFALQQRAPTHRNETKIAQSECFHASFLVEIRIGWKNDCWECVKYSHEEKKHLSGKLFDN